MSDVKGKQSRVCLEDPVLLGSFWWVGVKYRSVIKEGMPVNVIKYYVRNILSQRLYRPLFNPFISFEFGWPLRVDEVLLVMRGSGWVVMEGSGVVMEGVGGRDGGGWG